MIIIWPLKIYLILNLFAALEPCKMLPPAPHLSDLGFLSHSYPFLSILVGRYEELNGSYSGKSHPRSLSSSIYPAFGQLFWCASLSHRKHLAAMYP